VIVAQGSGTRRRPGPKAPPAARPIRARSVLVVEDSEVIRRVMSLILEGEGYAVFECPAGRDAIALARRVNPDVITLDLSLPDLDGRDLLRELRQTDDLAQVPVVILSAFADTLSAGERRQAADVIVKPFDLDDLLRRLDRVVREAHGVA
jgi:DNA-binding response OmpR family regulator